MESARKLSWTSWHTTPPSGGFRCFDCSLTRISSMSAITSSCTCSRVNREIVHTTVRARCLIDSIQSNCQMRVVRYTSYKRTHEDKTFHTTSCSSFIFSHTTLTSINVHMLLIRVRRYVYVMNIIGFVWWAQATQKLIYVNLNYYLLYSQHFQKADLCI